MAFGFLAARDLTILGKLVFNRFVLGMTSFCIGILFNSIAFLMIITSGLLRQSTGIYFLFLTLADTLALVFGVLMEEFYNDLIGVDVFADSDDPKVLCQAVYFMAEMFFYWRWFLLATLLVNQCLVVTERASPRRLAIFSCIFSLAWLLVSGGLAGYWIHFVSEILIPGAYTEGQCRITQAPYGDHDSEWFWMDAIVHLFIPQLLMIVVVLIISIVLGVLLHRQSAKALDPDDVNLSRAVAHLGLLNFLLMVTSAVINGIILYVETHYDEEKYGIPEDRLIDLSYVAIIAPKVGRLSLCVTFFMLLFSRQFRSACCRD